MESTETAPPSRANRWRQARSRRDWTVDWSCFVLAILFGVVGYADSMPLDPFAGQEALAMAAGVVGCLSLWYRRVWPVGIAILTLSLGVVSPAAGGASLIGLFGVAIHRPRWVAIWVGLFGLVTIPIYFELYPNEETFWINLIMLAVVEAAVIGWGMYVRARRELLASLRERTRQAEADRDTRLAQAREQERTRIAREMHDVLAHRISLVALNAGALEVRPDASPEEIARAAAVVRNSAHQALEELRDVILVLREPQGEQAAKEPPQPTLGDLDALIEESRQAGTEIEFDLRVEGDAPVPDATGRTAYRVVQEGLTNVRKHAPGGASKVLVSAVPDEGLTIEVSNRRALLEPVIQQPIPGSGAGLTGLAERVNLAGGRLEHGPQPTGEFRLKAWLPWPN